MKPWYDNFITKDDLTMSYTAWDESQANELGTFDSYEGAKQAVLDYARTLESKENS